MSKTDIFNKRYITKQYLSLVGRNICVCVYIMCFFVNWKGLFMIKFGVYLKNVKQKCDICKCELGQHKETQRVDWLSNIYNLFSNDGMFLARRVLALPLNKTYLIHSSWKKGKIVTWLLKFEHIIMNIGLITFI